MVWYFIGTFAAGVLLGFITAMLMKARGMQSREEEMREFYMQALEKVKERAAEEAKREAVPDVFSVLPRAIIEDPHFQNRLKQAGADFASGYADGIGL